MGPNKAGKSNVFEALSMATFNLRGEDDIDGTNEDAISAVNAALDFREAFKAIKFTWHEEWKSKANETIEFGLKCGISTGYVIVVNLGTEVTVVGSTVNHASRFAGLANKDNDILISQTTDSRVGNKFFPPHSAISVEKIQRKKSFGGVGVCFPILGRSEEIFPRDN
ncbi:MAG: adenylate/guanylate cyclase domain-containing protein [Candidatus Nitrosopolaris sp.]